MSYNYVELDRVIIVLPDNLLIGYSKTVFKSLKYTHINVTRNQKTKNYDIFISDKSFIYTTKELLILNSHMLKHEIPRLNLFIHNLE